MLTAQQENRAFVSIRRKGGIGAQKADGYQQTPGRVNNEPLTDQGKKDAQKETTTQVDQECPIRKGGAEFLSQPLNQ